MRGLIDNSVNIGGNQTVTGVKTFPNSPLVDTSSNQTIAGIKTFSSRVMAAAATNNGSALTTTALSKAQNGYVKLGNGIIIQWGRGSDVAQGGTVTFPTPFNTIGQVSLTQIASGDTAYHVYLSAISKTNFTLKRHGGTPDTFSWVAIGY